MKTFTKTTLHIEEKKYTELRDLLKILARDEFFDNITWSNEDNSGEIEIYVYSDFGKDLGVLVNELEADFEADEELDALDSFEKTSLPLLMDFSTLIRQTEVGNTIYYGSY